MKRLICVGRLALAMFVALISIPAPGQEVRRTILLNRETRVGDQVLPKGEYELRYVEGKDELVIARGKKQILTATYKVTRLDKPAAVTSVIYSQETDGGYRLKRIEFRGQGTALTFDNSVASPWKFTMYYRFPTRLVYYTFPINQLTREIPQERHDETSRENWLS